MTLLLAPLATLTIPPVQPRLYTTEVLDLVTSGGLPLGGSTLIGGAPGAGKSTLLIEAACRVPWDSVYVTGEETVEAIARRVKRLNLYSSTINVAASKDADDIAAMIHQRGPAICVVDSIQTIVTKTCKSAEGSPSQLKAVVGLLIDAARYSGSALVMVCHETKQAGLAGPRTIEHMPDIVLRIEREPERQIVVMKNRYGPAPLSIPFSLDNEGIRIAA